MPRLLLLLAIAVVLYILFRRAQSLPPHKRRGEYIKLALGVTVVIVLIATLTGRMHWVGAAFTGLLVALRQFGPLLVRLFPLLASRIGPAAAGSGGQTSTVETALLRMQLDHDTGNLEGEVLQGRFKDWRLADMDREQLLQLRSECEADSDSLSLLDNYLEQRFPGEAPFGKASSATSQGGPMNRAEALSILGLTENATEEDIVAAHRKLMQKLHPDRGGSDYLAAKINQAKDFLLGE
jgi:hypothetical protein